MDNGDYGHGFMNGFWMAYMMNNMPVSYSRRRSNNIFARFFYLIWDIIVFMFLYMFYTFLILAALGAIFFLGALVLSWIIGAPIFNT